MTRGVDNHRQGPDRRRRGSWRGHRASTWRRAAALVVSAGLTAGVASCSTTSEKITIGVPTADMTTLKDVEKREVNPFIPEARDTLRREYIYALQGVARSTPTDVTTTLVPVSKRINWLREQRLTMTYGCVGELLDELDPKKAAELRDMYAKEESPDRAQWRDITHSTMLSALPTDLTASDPGMAVACEDKTLPQNIVAVWQKPALQRDDRRALNNVAGGLATEDLLGSGAEHAESEITMDSQRQTEEGVVEAE